jgi:hypothetical protein
VRSRRQTRRRCQGQQASKNQKGEASRWIRRPTAFRDEKKGRLMSANRYSTPTPTVVPVELVRFVAPRGLGELLQAGVAPREDLCAASSGATGGVGLWCVGFGHGGGEGEEAGAMRLELVKMRMARAVWCVLDGAVTWRWLFGVGHRDGIKIITPHPLRLLTRVAESVPHFG